MAVVVTSQLSTVDACESTTPGWTQFGTVAALASIDATDEEQAPFAGTYCYAFDADVENGGHYATFTSTDYSGSIAYIAFACWTASTLEEQFPVSGQGGVYIVGVDSSGNRGYWHVGGSDTYAGGWRVFVADLSRTPDTNSGTAPNMAQCTGLGIGVNHLAKCKAAHNCFVDLVRVATPGQGLKITTTASTVCDLQDIVDGDGTELLRQEGGLFFTKAPLTFGDTTSGDVEFAQTGAVLVFEDLDVPDGHYGITVDGNSGGTIEWTVGTLTGGSAISGGTIRAAGTASFFMDFSDTNIDVLGLYGCGFYQASDTTLPVYSTTRKVQGCNFESCGEVEVSTCTVTNCTFISSVDDGGATGAVLMSSTSHNTTYCNFIACPDGVRIDTPGTYAFDHMVFTNCTYDIGNDSGGLVTINATDSTVSSSENVRCFSTNLQAQAYDYNGGVGSTYTNEATEARDTTANDMNLLGDSDEQEDAYYFGHSTHTPTSLDVDIGTNGAGTWTVTWEYYNGSWTALSGVTDGTTGFTAGTGWKSVTWTAPTDWTTVAVNSVTAYWLRARISAYTSTTTAPLGDQAGLIGTTSIKTSVNLNIHTEDTAGGNLQDAQCYITKSTPTQYTSHATANTQGDLTFEVQEAITNDTPSAGWLRVWTAEETEQLYRVASWTGSVFTFLSKIGPTACTGGGTSTSLQDTVTDFTAINVQVGDTVRNETDGSWATVLDIVDANNITTTPLQGGSDDTWTSGDNYSFHNLALTYDGSDLAYTPYMNEPTDASGDAASVTNYTGVTAITVKVRKYGYKTFRGTGSVSASGYSADIILATEPNVGL